MNKVIVNISARHLHVTQKDLETLFGKDYKLTNKKNLVQPGQFACEEKVDIIGPKNEIKGVSILGPVRNETQVEISLTDARTLGVAAKIRESGDIDDTTGVKLVGPKGEVVLEKGLIAAKRHIHLTPEEAKNFNVQDKQIVNVKISTNGRSLIFGDVVARVRSDFAAEMHIDTDEANAAGIIGFAEGEVVI